MLLFFRSFSLVASAMIVAMVTVIWTMGMLAVASKKGLASYQSVSPREFVHDVHQTVDDEPYGGGAGMLMMAPPIVDAVESLDREKDSPVILLTPAGKRFDQNMTDVTSPSSSPVSKRTVLPST